MIKKLIKENTINRDISWMYFNRRILDEATNESIPLLERMKYLGIYSNNLDEFYKVRVATISRMVELEEKSMTLKSDSKKILKAIHKLNEAYTVDFENTFMKLTKELELHNIFLVNETQLNENQKKYIRSFYHEELMNSLYPILVSRMQEIPELNDESIYMAVKISKRNTAGQLKKKEIALIEVPSDELSRFLVLPKEDGKIFIMFLDDVIRFNLPEIFTTLKCDVFEAYTIKFTRDAEMDFDNTAYQGLLEKVKKGVSSRKKGQPTRFVYDRGIPADLLKYTRKFLNAENNNAHVSGARYHNMKDLINFPSVGMAGLRFSPQPPLPVKAFEETDSIITLIREKDQFLHLPYNSFDYFIHLLREAAINPEVKEIKISIYRLAKNSKVVKALMCAAMNGKKVTAVVELLARFDETSNIKWANKMKDAGIRVLFGVEGLKFHGKLVHITARRGNLACISTGNFHEGTAGAYTDVILMTSHKNIVDEVETVFNFLEHPYLTPTFQHLIVAPMFIRREINKLIRTEIANAKKGKEAYIYCKLNHIVDDAIIEKLYQASVEGVKVKLLVRGNCSIKTGIPFLSDNIEVLGIIDRYLEHSRILAFANGGEEKFYIGSADWMKRNLDTRVEVYTPVYDVRLQKQLKLILEYGFSDNLKARVVDGSGKIALNNSSEKVNFRSQEELYKHYKKLLND